MSSDGKIYYNETTRVGDFIFTHIVLLFVGFILILKASDILVDSVSSIAVKLKIPKMLIALTIVAFGTCSPEIAISFQSIASHNGSMALANVIGSCIVNILLIIGVASIVRPIKVQHATIKKELPILVLVTLGFTILILDKLFHPSVKNVLSRADGLILLLLFTIFVIYLVQLVRKRNKDEIETVSKYSTLQAVLLLIASIIAIIISSDLIVDHATAIAGELGISQKLITMVAVVIGTSLPELFMTITSARKNEFDMAIGNIIGTNIFNICIVLGLPVTIFGELQLVDFNGIDILFVFLSSLVLYLFARSEKTISKREGIMMLILFAIYYGYIFAT